MRPTIAFVLGALALAGCSQNSAPDGSAEQDDIKTVAHLAGLSLSEPSAGPADRAVKLAECSAVLSHHAGQTPPPDRADSIRQTSDRLQKAALSLGEANGRPAGEMERLRTEAISAQGRLEASNAKVFTEAIAPGIKSCGLAEVMTDQELTQASPGTTAPALEPMPKGMSAAAPAG